MTMLLKPAALGLGAALVLAGSVWLASAQPVPAPAAVDAGGPLPVTFTTEQVGVGRATFTISCGPCHGSAPPGVPSFMQTSVGELFDFIRTNMPADSPGSLTPEAYAAIAAAFLQTSGYTAGTEPLPPDSAILARMLLTR